MPGVEVEVQVEGSVAAPIETVFDVFVPIDLTTIMTGYGPLPAVTAVEEQVGGWDAAGQTRVIRLADGSSMHEALTRVERPSHFAYQIGELTSPLRHLTSGMRGAWWFDEARESRPEAPVTHVRWRYVYEMRSSLTRPLGALIIGQPWRRYMKRALALASEQAEAKFASQA
jgi:hypothetical protein